MMRTPNNPRRRAAFTLVETVVALGVIAVVLLAAQSAVMIASRAVPDARSPTALTVRAGAGLERMMAELSYARTLVVTSASGVTFTVADRTGDLADETIAYAWAGKGSPVVRVMNGGTPESVIEAADAFTLAYDVTTSADPAAFITGAEKTLGSCSGLLGLGNEDISSGHMSAACFTPSMPANAVSFTPTRATISIKSNGSTTGINLVQVRGSWDGQPTSRVFDQTTLLESALSTGYTNKTVTFSGSAAIPAGTPVALVVQLAANSPSATVQVCTLSLALGGYTYASSSDTGITWSTATLQQLNFTLYGTITTLDTSATITRCTTVRCALSTPGGRANLSSGTRILSEPRTP